MQFSFGLELQQQPQHQQNNASQTIEARVSRPQADETPAIPVVASADDTASLNSPTPRMDNELKQTVFDVRDFGAVADDQTDNTRRMGAASQTEIKK